MTDFNADVGLKIFNARKNLKMSRVDLGRKVNLHESTIKRYEDGHIKSLDIEKLKEFANALDISPAYLMGWEDINNKNLNIENKNTISIKERKLLNSFNNLNETGKDEAIKRVSELTLIPSYIKDPSASDIKTIAAHNDHLTEHGEMDKVMQDIEDMDNW
ncbi:helix-turn-helix domain-containing protein [Paraclostridium bifermentans]|uniref:helix-turn-helix domain-containing protein n=1 Tax=Paraclostridium bifermentans TaxID=1490 RepID=UPI0022E54EB0|nr:helix-turn-helix transcriptional regulator [Paraclostridium bifermentans]